MLPIVFGLFRTVFAMGLEQIQVIQDPIERGTATDEAARGVVSGAYIATSENSSY